MATATASRASARLPEAKNVGSALDRALEAGKGILLAEQHVGFNGVDLVALLNLAAVAVAGSTKADRCHVPAV